MIVGGYTTCKDDAFSLVYCFAALVLTGIAICFLMSEGNKRLFPINEYRLEYKITTFEGKSDTTYVLIRK